jgi:hypothetical protein
MTLEVTISIIDGGSPDALIPIFVVEIETKTPGIGEVTVSGWWTESFGSLDALNAFLTGFRCATTLFGQMQITLPAGGISAHVLGWSRPRVLWPDDLDGG